MVGAAKGLGLSMLNMGDALSKRISTLEEAATTAPEVEVAEAEVPEAAVAEEAPALFVTPVATPRKALNLRLSLGVGAAVLAAAVGAFLLWPHPAAPPAQLLYAPAASAPSN